MAARKANERITSAKAEIAYSTGEDFSATPTVAATQLAYSFPYPPILVDASLRGMSKAEPDSQGLSEAAKHPSVDIVLVNWNAGEQLRRCLGSISTSYSANLIERVVVVDNASSDNSLTGLETLGLPLTIVRNPNNRGFGAACNQGAANSRADYLLFLNPDTRLDAASLADPVSFMEEPRNADVGVCGIKLVDENGVACRTCTRLPTPGHFFAQMVGMDKMRPRRFQATS